MTRRALFLLFLAPSARAERGNPTYRKFREAWQRYSDDQKAFADHFNAAMQTDRKQFTDIQLYEVWLRFTGESIPHMVSAGRKALDAISRGE